MFFVVQYSSHGFYFFPFSYHGPQEEEGCEEEEEGNEEKEKEEVVHISTVHCEEKNRWAECLPVFLCSVMFSRYSPLRSPDIMEVSTHHEQRLQHLLSLFLAENRSINLSAYRTEETCWVGNVLDSLAGIQEAEFAPGANVVEVGIGGGFPLLPLAISFPHVQFTGFDATKKKIDAVQRIVASLELTNVQLLTGRAEELGHDIDLREQFNVVLSRAVASLPTLLEFMSPFAKVHGRLISWKTLSIEDELLQSVNARMQLKCRLMERRPYTLPGDWGTRQLLFFEKTETLAGQFPRRSGVPKKEPL